MACLLAWAQTTVLSIAAEYVQEGVKAAINQFRYMCCLNKFQEELNQEEHALGIVQQEVLRIVEEEGKSTKVPDEPVEDWMKRTKQAMDDAHLLQNAIVQDKRCFNTWFPNWCWRYGRSKEAEGLKGTLENLKQERSQFLKLTHEVELPNIEFIVSKGLMLSKASEAALRDILKALQTSGVNMIGLHGMPGVGKTTLAIQAKEEAERQKLFDEFVKVTVTEKPNTTAIQDRIAEQLHLKFQENDSSKERASRLMLRLQDKKRKLIILDDVWGELKLNEIGIPSADDTNNCKILLTTRRIPVCESMNCRPKILLDILTEDEAWTLFKTTANLEDDSSALMDAAKQIAKECGRLPVAIISVAKALRGKSFHGWERALEKLKEGEHLEIRDMSREENAYKSLKFSFDELPREQTKRCLLLCSLFPEDYEICGEHLTRYALGLGLYQRARSLKDAISEVLDALDELKDSHLLLEAESKGYVKMHDLVRDVILLIGKSYRVAGESKMEKEFIVGCGVGFKEWPTDDTFSDCAAISLFDNEIEQLASQLDYPRLEMLLLARETSVPEGYVQREFTYIPDKSFDGMEKLQVLSLTRGILSLQSLESLTNLRTLELRHCKFSSGGNATTSDLTSLGNLKQLEILSFYGSDIWEFPDEIGELKNLKLLELTNCFVNRISPHVIEKLSKLEELHIGSFEDWDLEVERKGNPSLVELNSLRHLAILSLTFRKKIPENFAFSSNLTGYHIHICDCEYPKFELLFRYQASRTICICAAEHIVNACKELFKNVYKLSLGYNVSSYKNIMPDMSPTGFQDLSCLDVSGCDLECLISTKKQHKIAKNAFSNLMELGIYNSLMREICDGPPPEGFLEKLQTATVISSDKMITMFPAKLLQGMKKLERVTVEECEQLQVVFQLDGLDESNKDCLSHLSSLKLSDTDALISIWEGPTHHVNLKSLTHIILWRCSSLKYVISPSLAQSLVCLEKLDIAGCDQLEHIIAEKIEDGEETFSKDQPQEAYLMQKLKEVKIEECNRLEYIFPISIASCLLHLEELKISDAAQLKQVFGNGDENSFSKETEIELKVSSTVGYLFFGNSAVVLPSLRHVEIHNCPQLLMQSVLQVCPKASTNSEKSRVEDTEIMPLETIDLEECLQLGHIIAKEGDCDGKKDEISFTASFQPVYFTSLQKIRIVNCNRLKILFPVTVARNLPHLIELYIKASKQLVAIFGAEEQADINNMEDIVLPKLLTLYLEELPSLISFCPKEYHFVLPSLEWLRVKACPEMTTSFTATTDASVHIKPEALTLRQDTTTRPVTLVLITPESTDDSWEWILDKGKWISKEEAEKDEEEEEEEEEAEEEEEEEEKEEKGEYIT